MEQKTASQRIKTFQSKYLLDTNCFINLERFYPHDVFRSLDATIKKNIELKNIQTIEAIYSESIPKKNPQKVKNVITDMLSRYGLDIGELLIDVDNSSRSFFRVSSYIDKKIDRITEHYINKKDEKVKSRRDIQEINKDFMGSGAKPLCPDGLLIAKAMDMRITVVTEETKSGPMAKKIKIPDVCERFNVRCINFFELLRTENITF